MSIRIPLQNVASFTNNDEVGAGSVNGFVNLGTFTLPQDTDNIVLKLSASVVGGAVSAQIQTTDDGGTTWYGLGRTSVVSNANGDAAQFLSIPVIGGGTRSSSVVSAGSVVSGAIIGSAAPSTLSLGGGYTGLPVLSQLARVTLQMTAAVSTSSILTQVKVNSQSATA